MRKKRKPMDEVEINLPITPMLDMSFQLLTFFIFTYHPSALEGQMEMNLPREAPAAAKNAADIQPSTSDTDLPLPSDVTVIIRTSLDSPAPSEYVVEGPQGQNKEPIADLDHLTAYLKGLKTDVKNTENITIKADGRLKFAFVVDVMDVCINPNKAGFKSVGFSKAEAKAG